MKLVYVVKDTTYERLVPQLEALDRSLNALALKDADAQSESLRETLHELGIAPIRIPDEQENALREAGARELLVKTHLDAAETRVLRKHLAEGDLLKKVDAKSTAHLILLEDC